MSRTGHRRSREADVVRARSPALVQFFTGVMRRQMQRHFHAVRLDRDGRPRLPPGRPAIVYSNHPSWWDPAFFIILADGYFPGRKGYGPMDSEALQQYRFMRRIGIFGVEANSYRGSAAFGRTCRTVLSDPDSMLWVTAEGGFADPRTRPVRLRPGLAHLMARLDGIVAVPLAIEYGHWSERLPEALCRFGEPLEADPAQSVVHWRGRLEQSLTQTMDSLARKAMSRDPAGFDLALDGTTGIGGVYDLWRRARAAAAGRRFEPGHDDHAR